MAKALQQTQRMVPQPAQGELIQRATGERLIRAFLDLFVLATLSSSPKHGYQILKELKIRTGVAVGAGTLYSLLYQMEAAGLVSGEWVSPTRRTRRVYKLTDRGETIVHLGFEAIGRFLGYSRPDAS